MPGHHRNDPEGNCNCEFWIWILLFYMMWYGWDPRFNFFFNTFSMISFTLIQVIKEFLKVNGDGLTHNRCTQVFSMVIFLPCFSIYLLFGFFEYQKNATMASQQSFDKFGNYNTRWPGVLPYQIMLILSCICAFILLMILFIVVIPAWCKRNNQVDEDQVVSDEQLEARFLHEENQINNNEGLNQHQRDRLLDMINGFRQMHNQNRERRNGMTEQQIQRIESKQVTCDMQLDEECCSICLDTFQEKMMIRQLTGCNHLFHQVCIDEWLSRNASCPNCNTNQIQAHQNLDSQSNQQPEEQRLVNEEHLGFNPNIQV